MNDLPLPSDPALTVTRTNVDTNALLDRLTAAARLLASLPQPPSTPSLVFCRMTDSLPEAVPIGEGVTVGRGSDCALSLAECTGLSRRHFGVRMESGVWLVEDLGSRNGTKMDGVEGRISRRLLRDGDFIFAADLAFLFVNPSV